MGFNNGGAAAAAVRLRRLRSIGVGRDLVIGVNIGKTKIVPESEAIADYVISARLLARYADYLVVNVSSPNTPGLRSLQAVETLRPRSEEHTSELQSRGHLVCRLLLEKKHK